MIPSPCYKDGKDCAKRCVGCRSTCKDWKDWEIAHRKEREEMHKKKRIERAADSFLIDHGKRIKFDNHVRYVQKRKGGE